MSVVRYCEECEISVCECVEGYIKKLEAVREAATRLALFFKPYSGGPDCRYCGRNLNREHRPGCEWCDLVSALAALDAKEAMK